MFTSKLWGWLQLQFGTPAEGELNTVLDSREKIGAATPRITAPEGRAEYKKIKHRDGKARGSNLGPDS